MYLAFLFHYFPLGICYGFQVMESQESPNIPFTIFMTRFPEGILSSYIIVYDQPPDTKPLYSINNT